MEIQNVEFKARVQQLDFYEQKLLALKAVHIESQQQVDTYFNTKQARLKLRETAGQNSLIHYDRPNTSTAKQSEIIYFQHLPDLALKSILSTHLGIKTVVDKTRRIYAIENVRFHLDLVQGLGTFIEVEARNENNQHTTEELKNQCAFYFDVFKLHEKNLIHLSYSDLMGDKKPV